MIQKLDSKKCEQRNRIAAQRFGIESTTVRFLPHEAANFARELGARELASEGAAQDAIVMGAMPMADDEVMAAINARQPEGATPLTKDNVFVHYGEAASHTFIGDRYAFLSPQTLKNIARDAEVGVAFMNSHRTGGMSHPSELPFGRTFAGQYQEFTDENGQLVQRTIFGFYMVRGVYPNGQSGPSTDDLDAGIRGGTVFDVSVGLRGGTPLCDVCSKELQTGDCAHVPGTRHEMTDEQVERQVARGVRGGAASYTIDDADLGEVSAVYDGAVHGAGFRKSLAFKNQLSTADWQSVERLYSALLGSETEDMNMDIFKQLGETVKNAVAEGMRIAGFGKASNTEGQSEGEDLITTGDPVIDAHLTPPPAAPAAEEVSTEEAPVTETEETSEAAEESAEGEATEEVSETDAPAQTEEVPSSEATAENALAEIIDEVAAPVTEVASEETDVPAAVVEAEPVAETAPAAETEEAPATEVAPEAVTESAPESAPAPQVDLSAAGIDFAQLQAFVQTAVAEALAPAQAENEALRAEVARLNGAVTDTTLSAATAAQLTLKQQAEQFAASQKEANRFLPEKEADVVRDFLQAANDDLTNPITDGPSRLERFKTQISTLPQHTLTEERLETESMRVLLPGAETATNTPSEERRRALLSATPVGQQALKAKN